MKGLKKYIYKKVRKMFAFKNLIQFSGDEILDTNIINEKN